MSADKMQRMQLVIQPSLVEEIDQWRAKQPGLPNRSEAVRQLVTIALHPERDEAAKSKG